MSFKLEMELCRGQHHFMCGEGADVCLLSYSGRLIFFCEQNCHGVTVLLAGVLKDSLIKFKRMWALSGQLLN